MSASAVTEKINIIEQCVKRRETAGAGRQILTSRLKKMYEVVFCALLAKGDAAVEMVRSGGVEASGDDARVAATAGCGCVHVRVSDCYGGAISQSQQDSKPNVIIYLFILRFYRGVARSGLC